MRLFSRAFAALVVCVLCAGAINVSAATKSSDHNQQLNELGVRIHAFQKTAWHYQRLMGVSRSPTTGDSLANLGVGGARTAVARWHRLATAARRQAAHPPHMSAFLCIHHYEGSWSDSGAPFWGGLQMNYGFQATYGSWLLRSKGTADHWTPLEQIWTAEKALKSRGFYPWPNTARYCGLI
jgi:hypothetical protein